VSIATNVKMEERLFSQKASTISGANCS